MYVLLTVPINTIQIMNKEQSLDLNYQVINHEETLKYDVVNLEEFQYSPYNASTALFIDENRVLIFPNLHDGRCLITTKSVCETMFSENSFPVLPENDTAYFRYNKWMNKEGFNIENMTYILNELGLSYNKESFYADADKIVKTLSADDRKKLLIPLLYLIGEDLKQLCPESEWSFNTRYYLQPFNEPILFYEAHFYSFYDLNILLDQKLIEGKSITFKKIYEKVEGYFLKEKKLWEKR